MVKVKALKVTRYANKRYVAGDEFMASEPHATLLCGAGMTEMVYAKEEKPRQKKKSVYKRRDMTAERSDE